MEEHPGALITVVVDATFGHRIDKKEVTEFDEAVANNELVTPPAGAVGRGDAFVLSIANKAKAGILSNDSFQEFHGQYDWLFDQGRLIGGKPVPHVGWVFVERTPVRGPKSRQSVKEAKRVDNGEAPAPASSGRRGRRGSTKSGSVLANAPLPVPTTPPPGPARSIAPEAAPDDDVVEHVAQAVAAAAAPPPAKGPVNDLMPFLEFVERHPVGTSCTAVIESYSSHGAYARSDSVLVYIPLRLMDEPPPRSARSRLRLGEAVTLVVVGYAPERRSVDAALPHMSPAAPEAPAEAKRPRRSRAAANVADTVDAAEAAAAAPAKPSRSRRAKAAPAVSTPDAAPTEPSVAAEPVAVADGAVPERPATRRRSTKRASPEPVVEPVVEPAAPASRTRRAPKAAPAAAPAVTPAATPAASTKQAPAKKPATKKAAAKKAPAAKAPAAVKVPVVKVPVAKVPVAKAAAKRAPARRPAKGAAPATGEG